MRRQPTVVSRFDTAPRHSTLEVRRRAALRNPASRRAFDNWSGPAFLGHWFAIPAVPGNGPLNSPGGRPWSSRPGRPIRVKRIRLDFKVSRPACTPGIRETGTGGEWGTDLHDDECDRTCSRASGRHTEAP